MLSQSAASRPERTPRALRWIGVLLLVLVLHWIAAEWVERHRSAAQPLEPDHAPVQVALLKAERVEQAPANTTLPSAAPARAARTRARSAHVLTITRPATRHAVTAPPAADSTPDAASSETVPAASPASSTGVAAAASAASETGSAQASQGVKFSVPPSGDLQYDTFYNGVRNQPGTIHWMSDGHTYEMIVSVPLPFVGTFSYASHGHVDAFGIAPDQYIEKRGRRAEDVTIFNHADRKIAFTRTPTTLALPDGAQDRFSMIMQLASLVRGDPAAYRPGVTREFYVADNDSGEIWPIETIGDESVRVPDGFVEARHFMRLPRREGDRRRIDVWLAPSLGWLPVRLVQTEPNGTQIELRWRGRIPAPDSNGETITPAPTGENNDTGNDDTSNPSALSNGPGGNIEKP
ncbi:DUF3108 domain-containing protein [Paraburkholderia saeva]|uniref:DUF3108 domain-containing protein n=1 Tax=Paraburkholderia saeva TaxID=2777537 RepID=UPI001D6483D4|nr:DUF3108 domain-containing protein [Paraburkholderia saeva]CAG4894832.1 hypothetical protein R52603_01887 [Paraburkholderia saeva]